MLTTQMLRLPPVVREVHFWCMFPQEVDSALLTSYEKFLCPEEKVDLLHARTHKMQVGRILARTLVRTTLARYADGHIDPSSLRFTKTMFGKPQVLWPKLNRLGESWRPPPLCFNLSHTDSLIACGVALNSAVGIDVEERHRKPTTGVMKLARNKLSPEEADWLQHFTDSEEQSQNFMQEAYVKAVGKGISGVPFKDFSFHLSASPIAHEILREIMHIPTDSQAKSISLHLDGRVAKQERPSSAWKFVLFQPSPAHVASICVQDQQNDPVNSGNGKRQYEIQTWKTVPLMSDEYLTEGALGLAVSSDPNTH